MNPEVSQLVSTLTTAVEVILNPTSSQTDRQQAHKVCDEFKESSPYCFECGHILVDKQYSPVIRHFGLQLLEHCVKYRWSQQSTPQKDQLKATALSLIANGTDDILVEQLHIKDAVTRLVVEIMKHDWPAYWPMLMTALYKLCITGPTQTELVLKVFLRLAEDVLIFQNLQNQRRRALVTSLSSNISEIIHLFISLLQQHVNRANEMEACGQVEEKRKSTKVSEAVLLTLTGFLDWAAIGTIMMKDHLLLQLLCLLLTNQDLQLLAAECLLIVVSRKGKPEEREPVLLLFSEGAMSTIWNAAVAAEKASKDEYFYLFLKKLCQILIEIGKQLCLLWGQESLPHVGQPPNFDSYLEALLAFTRHPSQMLSSFTPTLWSTFLRHEHISKDQVFMKFLPRILETEMTTLRRVGFPSHNDCESCEYARLDFENDEDFHQFFTKYRSEMSEIIRQLTKVSPTVAYPYACRWLETVLQKKIDIGNDNSGSGICNLSSPSFIEWDALTVFFESIMSCLNQCSLSESDIQQGINMLKAVLSYQAQDPLIHSCQLSCISSLYIFLKHTPETLPKVLQKIFQAATFNLPGQTKATRSKAVKNVRQHACSALVKICSKYKELVFPVFDELYSHIDTIGRDPEQLSQMEHGILIEATILISNEYNNYDKQAAYLEKVMKPVKDLWVSEEFNQAFWSPDRFMSYIGLDQAAVEPSSADRCGINRSHISYCINMILAVIKRSCCPDDPQKAKDGGFVIGTRPNGELILRNPAFSQVRGLLENVLALLKTMNMLWNEEYLKKRHPDFAKAYDIQDSEKQILLGIMPPCVDNTSAPTCKQPLDRMLLFLSSTHSTCCHIVGNAGQGLGGEFYSLPNIADTLLNTVFSYQDLLPDYRHRSLIRVVLANVVRHCPTELYETVAIPVLAQMLPYMFRRLSYKWQIVSERLNARTDDTEEENPESQEMLDELLLRQVTRDYMDFLGIVLFNKKMETNVEEDMADGGEPSPNDRVVLELGKICLKHEQICEALVLTLFSGLTWRDSLTCLRACCKCYPVLKQIVADNTMTAAAAVNLYTSVLTGLHMHGHHDSCQPPLTTCAFVMYELLRPKYEDLRNVMLQVPKCTEAVLNNLEEKMFSANDMSNKSAEKRKREAFKKVVKEVIGGDVSQHFKREVKYISLPNLFKRQRHKQPTLDEAEHKDMGICALFKPEPDDIS